MSAGRASLASLAASVALAALALAGCGASEGTHGTLARLPVTLGPLGYAPSARLAIAPPGDARPLVEHEGDAPRSSFFFTVGVVTHWERRGSHVTDDETASPAAPAELSADLAQALAQTRVARAIVPAAQADFVLETEIEHLYATQYAASQGTVVVFFAGGRRSAVAGGGVDAHERTYASYGNVVLRAKLVDRRSGAPVVVWDEHVVGSAQQAPLQNERIAAQTVLRRAVADALATLSVRVGAALDRLEVGPSGPGHVPEGELPPVFLVERVSRYRDFLERVYVETTSGRVLRHDIVPNADRAYARPGDWILSRRTAEGVLLSGEGYEAYARALASRYDLRTYDDAYRYLFFGVLAD